MSGATLVTSENRFVEAADGVTYLYRRFGTAAKGSPRLVFL